MPLLHVKIPGNKVSCQLLHTQEYWYMIFWFMCNLFCENKLKFLKSMVSVSNFCDLNYNHPQIHKTRYKKIEVIGRILFKDDCM